MRVFRPEGIKKRYFRYEIGTNIFMVNIPQTNKWE